MGRKVAGVHASVGTKGVRAIKCGRCDEWFIRQTTTPKAIATIELHGRTVVVQEWWVQTCGCDGSTPVLIDRPDTPGFSWCVLHRSHVTDCFNRHNLVSEGGTDYERTYSI